MKNFLSCCVVLCLLIPLEFIAVGFIILALAFFSFWHNKKRKKAIKKKKKVPKKEKKERNILDKW